MATVPEIKKKIQNHQYVYNSIAYVLAPENANGDEKCFQSTCLNCENDGVDSLAKQFYITRSCAGKDSKILAHHYVQSFSPNDNITPELAHQIGVELAKKVAPGFQVIVSTHVDKDHIHNHFIINSVSMVTGLKWRGNWQTRNHIRAESDQLCQKYALSVIKNESGLRGIDQTTQKLAEKGKSWKVDLCHALDEAVQCCISKSEFIEFMKTKGFETVRYTDYHITFRKFGEERKIRANTLAKQFGDKYKKENLEKLMGYYTIPTEENRPEQPKKKDGPFISEWVRFEKNYFQKNPPLLKEKEIPKARLYISRSTSPLLALLKLILFLAIRRKRKKLFDKKYYRFHYRVKRKKSYPIRHLSLAEQVQKLEKLNKVAGNISYKDLLAAQGENFKIKVKLSTLPALYSCGFFFSAYIRNDSAIVTIKAKDKTTLQKVLGVEDKEKNNRNSQMLINRENYFELKAEAEKLGVKLEYLMISKEQFEFLQSQHIRFAYQNSKDGKINISFLPASKDYILRLLFPEKFKDNLFSVKRNSKVNTQIKAEALLSGQKIRYRVLSKQQIEDIQKQTNGEVLFSVFKSRKKQDGSVEDLGENQYNISFKESDEQTINEVIDKQKRNERK